MVLITALLVTSVLSQYRKTFYANSDCTGEINFRMKGNSGCYPEPGCQNGVFTECTKDKQTDEVEVPDVNLPWVLHNNYYEYANTTCDSGGHFVYQQATPAGGSCHKWMPESDVYQKVTCDGTTATFVSCSDKDCTKCSEPTQVQVDVCLARTHAHALEEYKCILPSTKETTTTTTTSAEATYDVKATTTTSVEPTVTTSTTETTTTSADSTTTVATSTECTSTTSTETTSCDKTSTTTTAESTETGIISGAAGKGLSLVATAMFLMTL